MRGVSDSLHTLLTCGGLVLVLGTLLCLSPVEGAGRETMRDRLLATHRQRRDLDMEGLPPEIRQKIAASRARSSAGSANTGPHCWVEVDVPQRISGVCRRIENMPACSVNDNLYINHPDCM